MKNPTVTVYGVLEAMCVLLNVEPSRENALKTISDKDLIKKLINYDKDHVPAKILKKAEEYTSQDWFNEPVVRKNSAAAGGLCNWVLGIVEYSNILKLYAQKEE